MKRWRGGGVERQVRKEGMYASHHPVRNDTDSSTYTTAKEEEEEGGRSGSDICVQAQHKAFLLISLFMHDSH